MRYQCLEYQELTITKALSPTTMLMAEAKLVFGIENLFDCQAFLLCNNLSVVILLFTSMCAIYFLLFLVEHFTEAATLPIRPKCRVSLPKLWSYFGSATFSRAVLFISWHVKYVKFVDCISSVRRQSFFAFQNNPKDLDPSYKKDLDLKDLDPSYKKDLDLWDCLGRVKLTL